MSMKSRFLRDLPTTDIIEIMMEKLALKNRSRPKAPSLLDMPIEIIGVIADKLNFMDRLVVRNVSRNLRDIIDGRKPEVEGIMLFICNNYASLSYDNKQVEYWQEGNGYHVKYGWKGNHVKGSGAIKSAIKDMSIVIKNPKLRLKTLQVRYSHLVISNAGYHSKYLKHCFKSLKHQIHVERLSIDLFSPRNTVMSILPFLKPGTLQVIELDFLFQKFPEMKEIVKLEQWKQAKSLRAKNTNGFIPITIEHLFHFDHFDIRLNSISTKDMVQIRDVLLKSPNFECGTIVVRTHFNGTETRRIFESDIPRDADETINYHVPDSDNMFKIRITSQSAIEFTKVSQLH